MIMALVSLIVCIVSMALRIILKLRLGLPLLYVSVASISTFFSDWVNVHEPLVLVGLFILLGLTVLSWGAALINRIRN